MSIYSTTPSIHLNINFNPFLNPTSIVFDIFNPISDILLRKINTNIVPQKLRFLESPTYNSTYTYMSDIDILICESILDFHKNNLIDNCYHNVIRGYCNKHTLMSRITFL